MEKNIKTSDSISFFFQINFCPIMKFLVGRTDMKQMQHKYSNDNPGKIGNYFIFSFHTFFLILKRLSINTLVHATLFKTTLAHTANFN